MRHLQVVAKQLDGQVAMVQKVADIAVTVLAATLAVAAPCVAQNLTMAGYIMGNRLLETCTSVVQRDRALCVGYVVGISDAVQAAQATGGALFGWQACLPPSTTTDQVTEVAVRFLIAHPEARQSSQAVSSPRRCRMPSVGDYALRKH